MTRLVQLLRQNFGKQQQRTKSLHLYISGIFYSGRKSHILYYKKNPLHDFTRMIWEENSVVTTKTSMICIQRMQKLWNKIYFYFYKNTMLKEVCGLWSVLSPEFFEVRLIHRNCFSRRTPSQNWWSASRIHQHTAQKKESASRIHQHTAPKWESVSRIHQLQPKNGGSPLETNSVDQA